MKKIFLSVLTTVFVSLYATAQYTPWTKDARNMIYTELLNELTIYNKLGQEQKESIALCGLEDITTKYSMSAYQSKIEVELRRIKSSTIDQCCKNIGVDLEKVQVETPQPSSDWSKDDRTLYYNEISTYLNKYELTPQEKERVSLCFVDEITKSYTKSDVNNFIEAEIKKIKNEVFKKCIESNGVVLKKQNDNKLNKKSIVACWQSYDFTLCFFDDGSLEKRLDKGIFKKSSGKWFLESDKVILVMKDSKEEYKVVFFSGESMKLEEITTKKELHFTKMFNF